SRRRNPQWSCGRSPMRPHPRAGDDRPLMDLGHGMWTFTVVSVAVLWAVLIAVSIWVLHGVTSEEVPHGEPAADALDRSLARGEISPEEYRERRDALDV